ncbi:modifier of mdg4 [Spodoptera frugiperda]|uniref:Modifier of mdg4 n=1 Tax=Spodoptera frugiperda TaxID=7108 RepID=A0A9R0EA44_SPOFR|nr:modifier of mdg4 [Spodoptera frugiperda]
MSQTERLSLSWDSHQKSICSGLSVLQQRGEYVDMTLAADGHYVKVHQMVVSLVSPYLKDLISTAPCPHPLKLINNINFQNISYTTLCAILEYVYTGEVQVPRDKLADLLSAGKALHIRGLREMDEKNPEEESRPLVSSPTNPSLSEKLKAFKIKRETKEQNLTPPPEPICKIYLSESDNNHDETMETENESTTDIMATDVSTPKKSKKSKKDDTPLPITPEATKNVLLSKEVQYSVSNQGGLQAIYNRYIYNLRYISKTNGRRFWRCVQYSSHSNCPANISTLDNNTVVDRTFTHNHPFEDRKILKKFSSGIMFAQFKEAETQSTAVKKRELKTLGSVITDKEPQ